jgi:hypothetical protein
MVRTLARRPVGRGFRAPPGAPIHRGALQRAQHPSGYLRQKALASLKLTMPSEMVEDLHDQCADDDDGLTYSGPPAKS